MRFSRQQRSGTIAGEKKNRLLVNRIRGGNPDPDKAGGRESVHSRHEMKQGAAKYSCFAAYHDMQLEIHFPMVTDARSRRYVKENRSAIVVKHALLTLYPYECVT
mmetsp:Transcript_36960/g.110711  ORF Transcript_36960/g.110711 Transcript_36960/m.110711 type:complete len:105 (+) Transcript_36960:1072-1386(+)